MRPASSTPPWLSWLGWLTLLSCSDGGGWADVFSTEDAPSASTSGGEHAIASSGGMSEGATGAGGREPQFGSEARGSAGESAMAGQSMSGAGVAPVPSGGAESGSEAGGGGTLGAAGSLSAGGIGGAEPPLSDELASCGERCKTSQDCRIGVSSQGFECNPVTQRCETLGLPCRAAVECLPAASLWFLACDSDQDCFYFDDEACVSVAGVGRCARRAPGGTAESSGCLEPTPDGVRLARFGSPGESVLVCADASRRCERGACVPGCRSDPECTPARNGSSCHVPSGACRCAKDEDCGGAGVSRCNTGTGSCECASDRDCQDVAGADVCVEGRCGCSSVAACAGERLFSGTELVCE